MSGNDSDYREFLYAVAQGLVPLGQDDDVIDVDDDDDEEYEVDDQEDEEEEDEDEDEEETEGVENLHAHSNSQSRVLVNSGSDVATTSSQGKEKESAAAKEESGGGGGGGVEEWNRSDMDGLFCPICMEAWTSGGEHQVCCLPCGHIYGMSCIRKWLQQRKSAGKCPQCNRRCTMKDILVLYASRIVAVDEELQKKVRSLEARCTSLEKEDADWCKKEVEWKRRESDLHAQAQQLRERTSYLEGLLGSAQGRPSALSSHSFGHNFDSKVDSRGSAPSFMFQKDMKIDGARFFDVDALNQYIIIARRLSGMGGTHVLTKVKLATFIQN